jgi:hypothetical protein
VTPTVATRYVHTFGNLLQMIPDSGRWITVPISQLPGPNGKQWITIETTSVAVSNAPWAPYGTLSVYTNTSRVTYQTNAVIGDYIVVPTNMCEIGFVSSQLTNVITLTNALLTATNFVTTNAIGSTNAGTVLSFNQSSITYFTNHIFVIYPVICDQTNVALRQGIEKVTFIRRDYDSLLTRFFSPITNEYTLNSITNSTLTPRKVRRTVNAPDFLFTARDLSAGPDSRPYSPAIVRSINFNVLNAYPGLAGPGTIEPQTTIAFNNVGPIYLNYGMLNTNVFLTELDQVLYYSWGSFDGTTNAPVVYPNDASVSDMELQVLVQISPPYLPSGTYGVDYFTSLELQASTENWHLPTSGWMVSPNSPGLPPGLQLMLGGDGTGLIFGNPQQAGTFDFVVRVMDAQGQTVERSYAIRIDMPQ